MVIYLYTLNLKCLGKIIKENPTDATKLLVQEANDNGGNDNITAIIIR